MSEWEARTSTPVDVERVSVDLIPVTVIREGPELTGEQREHRAAAIEAAKALAGTLGVETVHVAVSGNANPDHADREDLEAERITVTVWAARKG